MPLEGVPPGGAGVCVPGVSDVPWGVSPVPLKAGLFKRELFSASSALSVCVALYSSISSKARGSVPVRKISVIVYFVNEVGRSPDVALTTTSDNPDSGRVNRLTGRSL